MFIKLQKNIPAVREEILLGEERKIDLGYYRYFTPIAGIAISVFRKKKFGA